jgi:hypothetical protein
MRGKGWGKVDFYGMATIRPQYVAYSNRDGIVPLDAPIVRVMKYRA